MDARLRQEVEVSRGQFGFMLGKEQQTLRQDVGKVQREAKRTGIYRFGEGLSQDIKTGTVEMFDREGFQKSK